MERVLLQGKLKVHSTMSHRMAEVQKLSSILEANLCTKVRAKRWQAFMRSWNLYIYQFHERRQERAQESRDYSRPRIVRNGNVHNTCFDRVMLISYTVNLFCSVMVATDGELHQQGPVSFFWKWLVVLFCTFSDSSWRSILEGSQTKLPYSRTGSTSPFLCRLFNIL